MNALVRPQPELPQGRFVPLDRARIGEVVRLERRLYSFPWTRGNFEDALRSGYSAWAVEATDGALVAYAIAMLAVDEAHLLNLAVDTRHQRKGYGARLLQWIAHTMHGHGACAMLLEVRPSNLAAQHLYEQFGFTQIGVRRGYYPALWGREDAIVMRKEL